jgi:hypothetical protein
MNIRIEEVSTNKDGSTNVCIDFDDEGLKYLVQHAVIDILTQYAKQNPIKQPDEDANATAKPKARKRHTTSRRS